ncbi:helix-turn-helix transcriptional regulator [Streptomyces sp. AM 3-1-1]|uniref:helix-turn-helix domain-containing protein n=1 Tax=Streptomyces sp. AM 3-1-1 TaxID=3028711 RepID=UPI0023B89795|nr:helix-turn-helix transcriptional regulator [Streptomyces sp. AM 3-1-1]WEH27268.1 helix-turn-helix transcriptional regulator [Streptomyces sp. AM 3-1-1]
MLEVLGLDGTTEAVYRHLLTHPERGVADTARALALDESDVRRALDRLSALALVRPAAGPGPLHTVRPELGLQALIARREEEIAAESSRLAASKAAVERLTAELAPARDVSPGFERVHGIEAVRDTLAAVRREARTEVLVLAPGGGPSGDPYAGPLPDESAPRRDVRTRAVCLHSVRNSPDALAHARRLSEQGGETRTVPALPVRLVIVDRRLAILPLDAERPGAGAVIQYGGGVLAALSALFESIWEQGEPLCGPRRRVDEAPDSTERAVLRFLARGLTDDAIAKRLGVSSRTARRVSTVLMKRLGARSRFQAGAEAARRQWV